VSGRSSRAVRAGGRGAAALGVAVARFVGLAGPLAFAFVAFVALVALVALAAALVVGSVVLAIAAS
jgi:hypothetical protein